MAKIIGMSNEFTTFDQRALIKVCGIGGGGGNAVGRMIAAGLEGVDFVCINTDAQDLRRSPAPTRLQIGGEVTNGLGCGAKPDIGRKAAEEDRERIEEVLRGADMVFLTAGMGGGTGTGATPVVAEVASATGALTVAIVTTPFSFEGVERRRNAMEGLKALQEHVDALIVVPNDRLAELTQDLSFLGAFEQADEVLHNGVRAISEIITIPGLVNVDFADVQTIMRGGGRSLMGIGSAEGEDRARHAAEEAMVCPLLEKSTIEGATGVIVNIRGGRDIGMREVLTAVSTVRDVADPSANIIFGAVVEEQERPDLQVTVIASRFPDASSQFTASGERAAAAVQSRRTDEQKKAVAPAVESTSRPEAFTHGPTSSSGAGATVAGALPGAAIPPAAGSASAGAPPGAAGITPQKAERPEGSSSVAPSKPVERPVPIRKPEVQDLFPLDETVSKEKEPESAKSSDPEEDMSIPAFMRKRLRLRREKQK